MTAGQNREAVVVMFDAIGLSQLGTCRITSLFPSTRRYDVQRPSAEGYLSVPITELALERLRLGYQHIRQERLHVNNKRYTAFTT